jgi:hypothetical protein
MAANITGAGNVAIGNSTLANNTASCNTAIGLETLSANTTGCRNTAVGACSMICNTTGNFNTAFGLNALCANTTANNNTAFGNGAMIATTTGCQNTAIGINTLQVQTTGICNVAVGLSAGSSVTTGFNNALFGYVAGDDALATISTQCNQIVIGNTSHTCARIKIAWTVVSDARDKTCIDAVPHGLCFVKQLNPISFFYKKSRDENFPTGNKRYGFKAQDILPLEQGDAVIISDDEPENLKYNESSLIPVLVNAIKELTAKVEALENKS